MPRHCRLTVQAALQGQLNSCLSAQAARRRDMRHLPLTLSSMVSSKTSWVLRASPMDSPIPLRVLNPFSMLSRCWSCLFLAICQSCSRGVVVLRVAQGPQHLSGGLDASPMNEAWLVQGLVQALSLAMGPAARGSWV